MPTIFSFLELLSLKWAPGFCKSPDHLLRVRKCPVSSARYASCCTSSPGARLFPPPLCLVIKRPSSPNRTTTWGFFPPSTRLQRKRSSTFPFRLIVQGVLVITRVSNLQTFLSRLLEEKCCLGEACRQRSASSPNLHFSHGLLIRGQKVIRS